MLGQMGAAYGGEGLHLRYLRGCLPLVDHSFETTMPPQVSRMLQNAKSSSARSGANVTAACNNR
jgi:hypothetical protein